MNEQDLMLVIGMASLAGIITLADLIFSFVRSRQKAARARAAQAISTLQNVEDSAATARRESIRRRLAAIQSAQWSETQPGRTRFV